MANRHAGKTQANEALAERVYAYAQPQSARNQQGNPHGITLPESIAQRRPGEPADVYEKRIADEITFSLCPKMRSRFQR